GFEPRLRAFADRFIAAGDTALEAGKPREAIARYRVAIRLRPAEPRAHAGLLSAGNATLDPVDRNDVAWALVVTPAVEPGADLTAAAVRLARAAVETGPRQEVYRNTLGVALYRAGNLSGAVAELEESIRLDSKRMYFAYNGFFLAMARWRLAQRD